MAATTPEPAECLHSGPSFFVFDDCEEVFRVLNTHVTLEDMHSIESGDINAISGVFQRLYHRADDSSIESTVSTPPTSKNWKESVPLTDLPLLSPSCVTDRTFIRAALLAREPGFVFLKKSIFCTADDREAKSDIGRRILFEIAIVLVNLCCEQQQQQHQIPDATSQTAAHQECERWISMLRHFTPCAFTQPLSAHGDRFADIILDHMISVDTKKPSFSLAEKIVWNILHQVVVMGNLNVRQCFSVRVTHITGKQWHVLTVYAQALIANAPSVIKFFDDIFIPSPMPRPDIAYALSVEEPLFDPFASTYLHATLLTAPMWILHQQNSAIHRVMSLEWFACVKNNVFAETMIDGWIRIARVESATSTYRANVEHALRAVFSMARHSTTRKIIAETNESQLYIVQRLTAACLFEAALLVISRMSPEDFRRLDSAGGNIAHFLAAQAAAWSSFDVCQDVILMLKYCISVDRSLLESKSSAGLTPREWASTVKLQGPPSAMHARLMAILGEQGCSDTTCHKIQPGTEGEFKIFHFRHK